MNIEEKLKNLILSKYGTVKDFSLATELPYGTVDTILRRGIHKASVTNIIKICQTLGISTDELAQDRIVPVESEKSRTTDIDRILENTKSNIQGYDYVTINGEPMSQNEIDMLLDAIDIGIEIIKRNRIRQNEQ